MAYTSATPGPATDPSSGTVDRLLRRLFPSTSKLTFNPLFRATVNAFDVVPRLMFPEFRALPPNHLRIRVGVGNRILNNQTHFLVHARDFWMFAFSRGILPMEANILDIGVGCGRWAHWLRDYNFRGRGFSGMYVGVDIDGEAIEWCRKNYDAARFRFHHSSDASVSYNQNGSAPSAYRIPEADGTFHLVFSNSLLSHLLDEQLGNYLRETFRLLKVGGAMMHSHFNMEHLPASFGTRHTFKHQLGNARIESTEQPEAAVAYHTDYLFALCRQIGFSSCEIVHMPGGEQHQPILMCRK
jgi:2-polyprenyl-3-methyl-5-hydroxy-6-metoxy-1,4-benzoquinol methylase